MLNTFQLQSVKSLKQWICRHIPSHRWIYFDKENCKPQFLKDSEELEAMREYNAKNPIDWLKPREEKNSKAYSRARFLII